MVHCYQSCHYCRFCDSGYRFFFVLSFLGFMLMEVLGIGAEEMVMWYVISVLVLPFVWLGVMYSLRAFIFKVYLMDGEKVQGVLKWTGIFSIVFPIINILFTIADAMGIFWEAEYQMTIPDTIVSILLIFAGWIIFYIATKKYLTTSE